MAKFGFGLLRKFGGWFAAGFADRILSRGTGKNINVCFTERFISKIGACEPWTDHIHPFCITAMYNCIQACDYNSAVSYAYLCAKSDSSKYCINLARQIIDFIALGEEPIVELFPFME